MDWTCDWKIGARELKNARRSNPNRARYSRNRSVSFRFLPGGGAYGEQFPSGLGQARALAAQGPREKDVRVVPKGAARSTRDALHVVQPIADETTCGKSQGDQTTARIVLEHADRSIPVNSHFHRF